MNDLDIDSFTNEIELPDFSLPRFEQNFLAGSIIDVSVSLEVDAENFNVKIDNMSVEQKNGQLTYKQKALKHFRNQLQIRKDRLDSYRSPMPMESLSSGMEAEKMRAEMMYFEMQNFIAQLELIE